MKESKLKKRESGQALVEFAMVLPIFLLLVMGILDFGFLFYNYTCMENASRNAARVACVGYEDVKITYEKNDLGEDVVADNYERILVLPEENATSASAYASTDYSLTEKDICIKVAESLKNTGIDKTGRKITVKYTYDTSESIVADASKWRKSNRYNGDVIVTVSGDAHVLTPVLGIFSDDMKKSLSTSSTFKVEQQYTTTVD